MLSYDTIVREMIEALAARFACFIRDRHEPERHKHGHAGFSCKDCGKTGTTYDELGFDHVDYVNPLRRLFSRRDGSVTRTTAWEPTRRGF